MKNLRNLEKLQKLRRQKRLTDCLNFIEMCSGLSGDEAIFLLNEVGNLK